MEQDQIIASEIGIVSHDNDTSYLKIKNVDANSVVSLLFVLMRSVRTMQCTYGAVYVRYKLLAVF